MSSPPNERGQERVPSAVVPPRSKDAPNPPPVASGRGAGRHRAASEDDTQPPSLLKRLRIGVVLPGDARRKTKMAKIIDLPIEKDSDTEE